MSATLEPSRTIDAKPKTLYTVVAVAFVVAVVAQVIGSVSFNLGPASIVFFPMIWGLLIGAGISFQRIKRVGLNFQLTANAFVGIAVLFIVARLAFNVGPNLPLLLEAGPALLLQEVGHLISTVLLALPLAVLLRMGKATVGATFSLDREPAFAMVSEKYGPNSDEYRGVLAMYVFGTLFGAIYITFLTSLVINLNFFDPIALAMGAGVGSGSMMAASVASIVGAYPGQEAQVLSIAAVANLIATVAGIYGGIYISLPLADKFYKFLTRRQRRSSEDSDTALTDDGVDNNSTLQEKVVATTTQVRIKPWESIPLLSVLGLATASIFAGGLTLSILLGYVILASLVLLSQFLTKLTRGKIATIIWITTLGAILSSPISPVAAVLTDAVTSIDFLSIGCVALTFAGLSLGKDLPLLKTVGWKIIPVGIVAITAAFLLSTIIAEFALGLW